MSEINGHYVDDHEPVHSWFSLSYAAYAVQQRAILERMPVEWQKRYVVLMNELEDTIDHDGPTEFVVQPRDDRGRFTKDPLANYRYYDRSLIRVNNA